MTRKGEEIKACWICSSGNFVDDHHYDCQEGKLSSETVPLCRRCHRTYHDLGVGSFSPDTTEKALAVENKRREILRLLPVGHPSYQNLPPRKLEDIKRSSYWYKKHHIAPPSNLGKRKTCRKIVFRIPNPPPLCGDDWLREHLYDHTPEEIEALTIEITRDNIQLPSVFASSKKGTVKALFRGAV